MLLVFALEKDPRKTKFPLKPVESSEFNKVVQIDHQKIYMTDSEYNQILVILDHFTKLAERTDEEIPYCSSAFNKLPSLN